MGDITAPDGLQALVADLGRGNVIDSELLEGGPLEAHELDDMDAVQAAQVASHCFAVLFGHTVEESTGLEGDGDAGEWSSSAFAAACCAYRAYGDGEGRSARV